MLLFAHLRDDLHWQSPRACQSAIHTESYRWLTDEGSLTQKLIEKSNGQFRVEVLQQHIQRIRLSEQRSLQLPSRQWAVVREVVLYGADKPWVYARTIIPLSTLRGPLRRLHYLGTKPLGRQLFADPSMRRGPVSVAKYAPHNLPPTLATKGAAWGRRSVFHIAGKSLLVAEVLLPHLLDSD